MKRKSILIFISLLLILCGSDVFAAYQDVVMADSPNAYYRVEEPASNPTFVHGIYQIF